MKAYVFDIENNGFLPDTDTIHSLVVRDALTDELLISAGPGRISDGLKVLDAADVIIGHNIISHDLPVIEAIMGWKPRPEVEVFDTLLVTYLLWPDIKDKDYKRWEKGTLPGQLIGGYGLAAWGHRIGEYKGDFKGPWDVWTPEMQTYCEQDTLVNTALYRMCIKRIENLKYSKQALDIEHKFFALMSKMEKRGVCFDYKGAVQLYAKLSKRRQELLVQLQEAFPPWWVKDGPTFTPKVNNTKLGYTKGDPLSKVLLKTFNPGSRQHCADRLIVKYGWSPTEYGKNGVPTIDEDVLGGLPYPEAKLMLEYFVLDKFCGYISEGNESWFKHYNEEDGRIHGRIKTAAAATRRCTHSNPNLANIPSGKEGTLPIQAEVGHECRALFGPGEGMVMVGVDAKGLELRCLGHFLAFFDDGRYAKEVVEGDPHTMNQEAAGLPTRDQAKTFIYALLYGAGDAKIGSIIGKGPKAGGQLRKRFMDALPAAKKLSEMIDACVNDKKRQKLTGNKNGYLVTVDGGVLQVRHKHAALNTLLQSAGAVVCKLAPVLLYEDLSTRGWEWGKDWAIMLHVHDEWQAEVRPELVDEYCEAAVQSIRKAGELLNMKCPMEGDAKAGNNWAETH